MAIEEKLANLGLELPEPHAPAGNYVGGVVVGNLLFMSGVGPTYSDGGLISGKVGRDLDEDAAYDAARLTALNMLAGIKREIGNLDRVRRVVKTLGMVNAVPEFKHQPKVINGFSDLFAELYGEAGVGARSAVGMASLPFQIPVEVEMILEIETD